MEVKWMVGRFGNHRSSTARSRNSFVSFLIQLFPFYRRYFRLIVNSNNEIELKNHLFDQMNWMNLSNAMVH